MVQTLQGMCHPCGDPAFPTLIDCTSGHGLDIAGAGSWFGPFNSCRARYFGIDTTSILRAPSPCWTERFLLQLNVCVGGFGIAIDTFGYRPTGR